MDARRPRRLRTAVFALLGVLTAASLLGTALSPYLLVRSPLLLVAISPAAHHVVLAAASVDPVTLVTVATLRRALTCVGAYGIGFLYGSAALGWLDERYPRVARFVAWVELLFARFGVWLLVLVPTPTVSLFAGAARSHFMAVLVAVIAGLAAWHTVTVHLGDSVALWTDLLTGFVGEHLLESTLICVALLALKHVVSRWLGRRRRPSDAPIPPS